MMYLYQFTLFVYALCAFPYYIWRYGMAGIHIYLKRWRLPKVNASNCYWVHAVSLGEVKVALGFISMLKEKDPHCPIVLSTTTQTGYHLAEKHGSELTPILLPFDLMFLQRRLINKVNPRRFFFIEGDLWFSLITLLNQHRVPIAIINAKMSMRSYRSYRFFGKYVSTCFSSIQSISAQTPFDCWAYNQLGSFKCNIKHFDNVKLHALQATPLIAKKRTPFIVSLVSTHPREEKLLLDALYPLFLEDNRLQLIIAPRHPERFSSVYSLLQSYYISASNTSSCMRSRMHLWDVMGQLNKVYAWSSICIIGGSFVPIGGHNIIEPLPYQALPFVGPHMNKQRSLLRWARNNAIVKQCNIKELPTFVKCYMQSSKSLVNMQQRIADVLQDYSYPKQELVSFSLK